MGRALSDVDALALLGAARNGDFAWVRQAVDSMPTRAQIGNGREILTQVAGILLHHDHVRGSSELGQRWNAVSALFQYGVNAHEAVQSIGGGLRALPPDCLELLLRHGLRPSDPALRWTLWQAWVREVNLFERPAGPSWMRPGFDEAQASVRLLCRHGLSAQCTDDQGRPLFQVLASSMCWLPGAKKAQDWERWIDLLLECGAAMDGLDLEDNTLLHATCDNPGAGLVPWNWLERLCGDHPDWLSQRNRFGQTPAEVFKSSWRQAAQRKTSLDAATWQARAEWLEQRQHAEQTHQGLSRLPVPGIEGSRVRL